MLNTLVFKAAFPYQKDVLALPVSDLDKTSEWYGKGFGMVEVERHNEPVPTVILERDGIRIGFSINGGDASQDGVAILVSNIVELKAQFESKGVKTGELRTDVREGRKFRVFFVVANDGLCFYFHEPLDS